MSVTYGFFNSSSGDRVYNAVQMSELFDGLIEDGIYMSQGGQMLVTPQSNLTVQIDTGRAWFDHTWTLNDAVATVTLDAADSLWPRYDAIVLKVDFDNRVNSFTFVKGTAQAVPEYPDLSGTSTVHYHALAYVYVPVGLTTITQANIINNVGMESCPFVVGVVQNFAIDSLIAQWQTAWNEQITINQTQFDDWFDNLVDQLTGVQVTNLQNQIDDLVAAINAKVVARQGYTGNSNWDQGGSTNFSPISTGAIQVGNYFVYGATGLMTVTFPQAFSSRPLVFLTVDSVVGYIGNPAVARLTSVSTTGFTALITVLINQVPYWIPAPQLTSCSWLAIGPQD